MADRTAPLLGKREKISIDSWKSAEQRERKAAWTGSGLTVRERRISRDPGEVGEDLTIIKRKNGYLRGEGSLEEASVGFEMYTKHL